MRAFFSPRACVMLAGAALALASCAQVLGLDDWKDPPPPATGSTDTGTGTSGGAHGGASPGGPDCNDGVKNGLETGVDCGGDACPPCGDGDGCNDDADCASGACTGGMCAPKGMPTCDPPGADATCNDCQKNGLETDVDCGGDACLPCGSGLHCANDGDCTSARCAGGVCAAGAPGLPCRSPTDCASGACSAGACWTGSCCR